MKWRAVNGIFFLLLLHIKYESYMKSEELVRLEWFVFLFFFISSCLSSQVKKKVNIVCKLHTSSLTNMLSGIYLRNSSSVSPFFFPVILRITVQSILLLCIIIICRTHNSNISLSQSRALFFCLSSCLHRMNRMLFDEDSLLNP